MALLETHNNFGAAPGQITIIKQEKVSKIMFSCFTLPSLLCASLQVAALTDNDASIALSEHDPYEIDTKPHGCVWHRYCLVGLQTLFWSIAALRVLPSD